MEAGNKHVRISKLFKFILRIIGVLEMMNAISVAEIKSILNIGIVDCFEFGYPNLTSLLQSFSDIFFTSSLPITELSEITLNKQNIRKCN